jgi:hypothetical protein
MSSNYAPLFTVNFKHDFFSNGIFAHLDIKPTNETLKIIRDYELVIRKNIGSFSIHYPTVFASSPNTRTNLLSDKLNLHFTLLCNDSSFMNYTSNLPNDIENKMFLFQYPLNKGSNLHVNQLVTEIDMIDFRDFEIPYFAKPFGHLKIVLDQDLPIENFIKFAAPSLYWRYIIRSPHLLDYSGLAITNKNRNIQFDGPYPVTLPNGDPALSFVSPNIIPQKELTQLTWQLVEQFNTDGNGGKTIIPNLQHPNHKTISFIGTDYNIEGQKRVLDIII